LEGVENVQFVVFHHFASNFKAPHKEHMLVENLQYKTPSNMESRYLIKSFSLKEVKQTVWDCDSFIKYFWEEIKDDMLRFITEFHRNGRLEKGINYTFISIIPKVDI
jgi:hypothetical protein